MTILQFFLWSLLKVAVVTVVMLLGVAYTVLLERKLVGRIQNRWGPSRVGPFGLLAAAGGRGEIVSQRGHYSLWRLPAAVSAGSHYRSGLRADLDCRGALRRAGSVPAARDLFRLPT